MGDTPFLLCYVAFGFSPKGVVFGILWNRGVFRPNVATLKRCGVWDFTHNHEAAGSDVWLEPVPSFSSGPACRPLNPWCLPKGEPKKKRARRHVTQEEGSTCRYDHQQAARKLEGGRSGGS